MSTAMKYPKILHANPAWDASSTGSHFLQGEISEAETDGQKDHSGFILGAIVLGAFVCLTAMFYSLLSPPKAAKDVTGIGVAASVRMQAPDSRLPVGGMRITTKEGHAYYIQGIIEGVAGTKLTMEHEHHNKMRYLCGGIPKSCAVLADYD